MSVAAMAVGTQRAMKMVCSRRKPVDKVNAIKTSHAGLSLSDRKSIRQSWK